jgi:hypothetical protein
MTYEPTRLRLVSLPPAGAALLEVRDARENDLALPLSHLHRTPHTLASSLRVFCPKAWPRDVPDASRTFGPNTPYPSYSYPPLLLRRDQSSLRGSVHEE